MISTTPLIQPKVRLTLDRPRPKPKPIERNPVLNLYQPEPAPSTLNALKPMHLYDINCAMPFHILETDAIRLEPLIPSKHLDGVLSLPAESWDVLGGIGPFDRRSALETIESYRQDEGSLLLAAIDKHAEAAGKDGFAGVYALDEYDEDYASVLFGMINIHPRYHRTHINTHAVYLLLSFLFDEVNLVRVQWDAVVWNEASIRAAKRFGFQEEGILRNFNGIVPNRKRRKSEAHRLSQDMWISSMTDYEWANGERERIKALAERPVPASFKGETAGIL